MMFIKPGGPGSAEEAAPYMDEVSAYLSARMEGVAIHASYCNDAETALRELRQKPADVAVVSLGFFLAHHREFMMKPMLQTRPRDVRKETYRILTHKDSQVTLQGLTELGGNVVFEETFARSVILEGRTQATFSPSDRPLSVIRRVMRGTYPAVLVDEAQYQGLLRLHYMQDMKVLYVSKEFPTPPVVTLGDAADARMMQLKRVFMRLETTPTGKAILEDLNLEGFFKPVREEVYLDLERRYHGGALEKGLQHGILPSPSCPTTQP